MKEIVIEIDEAGEIKIETRGFTGKSCLIESQFIKDVLGHETSRQLVPTYWQNQRQTIKKHLPICG